MRRSEAGDPVVLRHPGDVEVRPAQVLNVVVEEERVERQVVQDDDPRMPPSDVEDPRVPLEIVAEVVEDRVEGGKVRERFRLRREVR